MKVDLIFPALPPTLDGIGDYTSLLAAALARQGTYVRILTAQDEGLEQEGVAVHNAFSVSPPSGVFGLRQAVAQDVPVWLVLQYNPFSYGRYGFNPWLPEVLARIKREHLVLRIALMVHEPFVMPETWQFAIMTLWQRWQMIRLGQVADLVIFAIEPWTRVLRKYVSRQTHVVSLPVGSNIPHAAVSREQARADLNLAEDELVVGIFGSARRLLYLIDAAVARIGAEVGRLRVLYVGPDGTAVRSILKGAPLLDLGARPPEEVSRALSAMDIHLAPYPRGVSARRGAFIAGIQHGVPTVTTVGENSDPFIAEGAGTAFMASADDDSVAFAEAALELARDPSRRKSMSAAGVAMHARYFEWDDLAGRLLTMLQHHC